MSPMFQVSCHVISTWWGTEVSDFYAQTPAEAIRMAKEAWLKKHRSFWAFQSQLCSYAWPMPEEKNLWKVSIQMTGTGFGLYYVKASSKAEAREIGYWRFLDSREWSAVELPIIPSDSKEVSKP